MWRAVRQRALERDEFRCVSCRTPVRSAEADIHHLLPRSMGGDDELSNLVTLCDGCHAAHHPTLQGGLARRVVEKWAIRLAKWLDREGIAVERSESFGPALRIFGLDRFRQGQLQIVLAALSGKSILVVSPTGSGKTLCFQLPALLRKKVSLVVSPLKTLMTDQVSTLLRKKIPATFINSDLSKVEKEARYAMLEQNAFKLLYVAPERFFVRSKEERECLFSTAPSFLVVDEAHCVDQWGTDFRPEYGKLAQIRGQLGSPPILAFTATAGKEMQRRILSSLGIPDATVFVRDVDRPNIALLRRRCPVERRYEEIAELLRLPEVQGQKVMVFVPSTKAGVELQGKLADLELDVPFYHARLGTPFERQELQKRFQGESRPEVNHIICTNAFGMGLDIPNVRLVIHLQQSASVEDLLQEFGRAGRDRKPSVSIIFHDDSSDKDIGRLRFMADRTIDAAEISETNKKRMRDHRYQQIDQVAAVLTANRCFRQEIREYFGASATAPKRSIAAVILEWVFGTREKSSKTEFCCDSCDRTFLKEHGFRRYVSAVLQKIGK
jgi:ATP-dependent DNA helicase RecQ